MPPEETPPETRTEGAARPWLTEGRVIQLRAWETDATDLALPVAGGELVIGAHASAEVRLDDPQRKLSRQHARLIRDESGDLYIEDLGSRNGIHLDGVRTRQRRHLIRPGMEIRIGSLTFVAESAEVVRLRSYLQRILGWQPGTRVTIEHTRRAMLASAAHRGFLWFIGDDDLVAVARQLHLRTTAPGSPFVVCGGSRSKADTGVGITTIVSDVAEALTLAVRGTVCVRADDLPERHDALIGAARNPAGLIQLYVCARDGKAIPPQGAYPILVPPLARRGVEDLQRIIDEYALDAMREFAADASAFDAEERAWILEGDAGSFADLEMATSRVVACNAAGNVHLAALWLGLSHVGLGGWFDRRPGLKR